MNNINVRCLKGFKGFFEGKTLSESLRRVVNDFLTSEYNELLRICENNRNLKTTTINLDREDLKEITALVEQGIFPGSCSEAMRYLGFRYLLDPEIDLNRFNDRSWSESNDPSWHVIKAVSLPNCFAPEIKSKSGIPSLSKAYRKIIREFVSSERSKLLQILPNKKKLGYYTICLEKEAYNKLTHLSAEKHLFKSRPEILRYIALRSKIKEERTQKSSNRSVNQKEGGIPMSLKIPGLNKEFKVLSILGTKAELKRSMKVLTPDKITKLIY